MRKSRSFRPSPISALEGRVVPSHVAPGGAARAAEVRPVSPALPSTSLIPPAAEVAEAESVLSRVAGRDFAKYARALSTVERYSTVTPARFTALAQDKAAIDAAIEGSDLSSAAQQDTIDVTSDHIDAAFTDSNAAQMDSWLEADLSGVSLPPQLLQHTFTDMNAIALAARAHVPRAAESTLARDGAIVARDLGPNPDTTLGPGPPRDPLDVYYNGQVADFVHA